MAFVHGGEKLTLRIRNPADSRGMLVCNPYYHSSAPGGVTAGSRKSESGGRGPSLPICRRHNSVGVVRNNGDADRVMLDAQPGGDRRRRHVFTPDARCRRRAEGIRADQKRGHAGSCMQKVHCGAPAGVAVTVSARLHLGFLDLNGEFGRQFGSLGLSISEPRGRLTLRRASAARVRWPDWGFASRGATRSGVAVRALAERR
jgi:hypothetical protein